MTRIFLFAVAGKTMALSLTLIPTRLAAHIQFVISGRTFTWEAR